MENRKVVIYAWVRYEENKPQKRVVWGEGVFLAWGVEYTNDGTVGYGHYSTAIVELADGSVINVRVEMIQFKKELTSNEIFEQYNFEADKEKFSK